MRNDLNHVTHISNHVNNKNVIHICSDVNAKRKGNSINK